MTRGLVQVLGAVVLLFLAMVAALGAIAGCMLRGLS